MDFPFPSFPDERGLLSVLEHQGKIRQDGPQVLEMGDGKMFDLQHNAYLQSRGHGPRNKKVRLRHTPKADHTGRPPPGRNARSSEFGAAEQSPAWLGCRSSSVLPKSD